ncbi:hypothetical protein L1987_59144 [Smallanthus sonchifolius]|uniref:Uncharacterized protein n=1 Tax=Smallanthus sonchifolius TaxID=185202 RepID=A0ACB9D4V8_9ASTR|nr:hypothetical protein L1987_59144 [Smallanthus sonchifolius]
MGGKGPIEKIWYTPNLKKQIGMVGQVSLQCFRANGSGNLVGTEVPKSDAKDIKLAKCLVEDNRQAESYLQYIPARVQLYTWEGYVSGLVVELEFGLGLVVVHSKVFDVQMWDKE